MPTVREAAEKATGDLTNWAVTLPPADKERALKIARNLRRALTAEPS